MIEATLVRRCTLSENDRTAWAAVIHAARRGHEWALDALLAVHHPDRGRPRLTGLLARDLNRAIEKAVGRGGGRDELTVAAIDAALDCVRAWEPGRASLPRFVRATLGRRLRGCGGNRREVTGLDLDRLDQRRDLRHSSPGIMVLGSYIDNLRASEPVSDPDQARTIVVVARMTRAEAAEFLRDLGHADDEQVTDAASWQRRCRYRERIRAHEEQIIAALGLEKKVRRGA